MPAIFLNPFPGRLGCCFLKKKMLLYLSLLSQALPFPHLPFSQLVFKLLSCLLQQLRLSPHCAGCCTNHTGTQCPKEMRLRMILICTEGKLRCGEIKRFAQAVCGKGKIWTWAFWVPLPCLSHNILLLYQAYCTKPLASPNTQPCWRGIVPILEQYICYAVLSFHKILCIQWD